MAPSFPWPVVADKRLDWDRNMQVYGYCEVVPDKGKPGEVEKSFRDWASKRRLALVEGERMSAFDPKAFNPKDVLDRTKYGFLARYFRTRARAVLHRDLEQAFGIRSVYVRDAIQKYWAAEGIIHEQGGEVQADHDLLRLMGFTYLELMHALDGVVKKEWLQEIPNGHRLMDPVFSVEYGHYLVNFEIMKERFFDASFILQVAGKPIPMAELGHTMGIDDLEDLRKVLREAKKRYDLNVEVSEDHVMFGPPSEASVQVLISKERSQKSKLQETEGLLKDRVKTTKELLERYTAREAKILNEIESLKEEGRMVFIKSKVVSAVQQRIDANGRK